MVRPGEVLPRLARWRQPGAALGPLTALSIGTAEAEQRMRRICKLAWGCIRSQGRLDRALRGSGRPHARARMRPAG